MEGAQEIHAGGQHQGDGIAPLHPALTEPPRHRGRLAPQPAVGDRGLGTVVLAHEDGGAVGVGLGVAEKGLVERLRLDRRHPGRVQGLAALGQAQGLLGATAFEQRPGEVGRGVDLQVAVVEGTAEGPLQPDEQLDPLQTAEAHLTVKRGIRSGRSTGAVAPGLAGEPAHDLEDVLQHVLVGGRDDGLGHSATLTMPLQARNRSSSGQFKAGAPGGREPGLPGAVMPSQLLPFALVPERVRKVTAGLTAGDGTGILGAAWSRK